MFISSTSDLRSARGLVANVLHSMGYDPIWQEIEPTDGGELLGMVLRLGNLLIHLCGLLIDLACLLGLPAAQKVVTGQNAGTDKD